MASLRNEEVETATTARVARLEREIAIAVGKATTQQLVFQLRVI